MRWFSDLSGVFDEPAWGAVPRWDLSVFEEAVLPVAVAMGGESTRHSARVKAKFQNPSRPQGEVKLRRAFWTV
jgi:hypothetical protein